MRKILFLTCSVLYILNAEEYVASPTSSTYGSVPVISDAEMEKCVKIYNEAPLFTFQLLEIIYKSKEYKENLSRGLSASKSLTNAQDFLKNMRFVKNTARGIKNNNINNYKQFSINGDYTHPYFWSAFILVGMN